MKPRHLIHYLGMLFFASILSGQTNQVNKLFIPFLDKESQSNVIVSVSDLFNTGIPCPKQYTNVISNTNLFSLEEQSLLRDIFMKYRHVTTNSGPPGTQFAGRYKTNLIIKMKNKSVKAEEWVTRFQYTNLSAYEDLVIRSGISAKFRTLSSDGYNLSIVPSSDGSLLRFMEVKGDLANGVLVEFDDIHSLSTNRDFRLANFKGSHLVEYRNYINGMVLGKFLMWNPFNDQLLLEADFKEPYDFQKHRTDFQIKR
jgi:hypothetical protein